ncbi:NAD(P)-binding protein [Thozetella sp. PMI_491]|nr:NAD(P)-binding protein [Thozetella sp. PMI_491]
MVRQFNTDTTGDELIKVLGSEIKGKVVLTTGVTKGGIGGTFVETIAKAGPALLILASRNLTKTQETADAIHAAAPDVKVRLLQLNLGSLAAVCEAAATVNAWDDVPSIDVVVNNAGLMATDFALTEDGFESQFGTNHLGHFLFTNLIMSKVLASQGRRIVSVSSDGHRLNPMRWADHNFSNGETYNRWHAYGQSKTANILMALSLAEKLGPRHGLVAVSLHPGVVEGTALGSHLDWNDAYPGLMAADKALGNAEGWNIEFKYKSQQRGIATHVYAAFEPSLKEHNGTYLQDSRIADPLTDTVKPWATSPVEAERLWKISEKLVGQEFPY